MSGEVRFSEAKDLKPKVVRDWFGMSLPYTLSINRVTCEGLSVTVPWRAHQTKVARVSVDRIKAEVIVRGTQDVEWALKVANEQRTGIFAANGDLGPMPR
jgi:hypothetical protein